MTVGFSELTRSIGPVLCLWAVSLLILAGFVVRNRAGVRQRLQALWKNEDGAAYSLSWVMTFPVVVLFVCLVIETTLLLVVKAGTVYGAYAAARAAAVWQSALPAGREQTKANEAAVQAMVPFATASSQHAMIGSTVSAARAGAWLAAYRVVSPDGAAGNSYLARKYRYSASATKVSLAFDEQTVTATLRFPAPLHVPGVARLMSAMAGGSSRTWPMETSVTLENHTPRIDGQHGIGINYRSE